MFMEQACNKMMGALEKRDMCSAFALAVLLGGAPDDAWPESCAVSRKVHHEIMTWMEVLSGEGSMLSDMDAKLHEIADLIFPVEEMRSKGSSLEVVEGALRSRRRHQLRAVALESVDFNSQLMSDEEGARLDSEAVQVHASKMASSKASFKEK